MACGCVSCRTGKCQCQECRSGPGIDFKGRDLLAAELRRDIAIERVRVRDLRAISPERQRVRRWGDIIPSRTENPEDIRN